MLEEDEKREVMVLNPFLVVVARSHGANVRRTA